MIIGTSLGKCIKDILDGKQKITDILCIVANTMIEDQAKLAQVIEGYYYFDTRPEYDLTAHSLEDCIGVANALYESGLIHQPRLIHGLTRHHKIKETWLEIAPDRSNDSEAAIKAYEHYQMVRNLTQ